MSRGSIAVMYCVHDDFWFLRASIRSWKGAGRVFAFVSRVAWDGSEGDWQRCAQIAEDEGVDVILGEWPSEEIQRRASLEFLSKAGYSWAMIPDGDEVVEPSLLRRILDAADANEADRIHVHMDTYWKSASYVIRPRELLTPIVALNVKSVQHHFRRSYYGGSQMTIIPSDGILHHLSYAGPDERIKRKISTWDHRTEVLPCWYEQVWLGWDADPNREDIHPTDPHCYKRAVLIQTPDILHDALEGPLA